MKARVCFHTPRTCPDMPQMCYSIPKPQNSLSTGLSMQRCKECVTRWDHGGHQDMPSHDSTLPQHTRECFHMPGRCLHSSQMWDCLFLCQNTDMDGTCGNMGPQASWDMLHYVWVSSMFTGTCWGLYGCGDLGSMCWNMKQWETTWDCCFVTAATYACLTCLVCCHLGSVMGQKCSDAWDIWQHTWSWQDMKGCLHSSEEGELWLPFPIRDSHTHGLCSGYALEQSWT